MAVKAKDILAEFDKKNTNGKPSADQVLSTFDNVKKKDASGSGSSVSPSGTTPTPKTGQPINTLGSGSSAGFDLRKSIIENLNDAHLSKNQLKNNYKDNSITADDVNSVVGDNNGLNPEHIATGINNKGKNLSIWGNAPTENKIKESVDKIKTIDQQISFQKSHREDIPLDDKQMNELVRQREEAKGIIQKQYEVEKEKVLPDILTNIKAHFGNNDWSDVFDNPNDKLYKTDDERRVESGLPEDQRRKSPLQWNAKTHMLTPESAKWVNQQVDAYLNHKNNSAINAGVSGDLDRKERTYPDVSKSIINYLNTVVPVEHAQKKYADYFYKAHPEIKEDAVKAQKEFNDFFSKSNIDAANAFVNTWRDKEFIKTGNKYYGREGIFNSDPGYVSIAHKYAERVAAGEMSDEVARKNIDREVEQNPALKKVKDAYDIEIKKINESTQDQWQNYIVNGLKKVDNRLQLRAYKNGSIGLAGINSPNNTKLQKEFEEGYAKIPEQVLGEQASEYEKQASEKAKRVGPFWASVGGSINDMTSAVSKMVFNKTGWGGDKVRYYEAQETSSPQISQSQEAAKWNWKGVESLADANFWKSKVGGMVPVIAGAGAIGIATEGEGIPQYVSWLANAGLFTAQSGLSTYNQLLGTKDEHGNLISEDDASHFMARDMAKNFLPNLLMMAATSGTLFRAKGIVKPTIAKAALGGLKSAAISQPFFTWQGYNSYANMKEATGGKADIWDYMQSPDFRDNLINGMVVGGGLSLLHAPGTYIKGMKDWTTLIHSSEGEFKANSLYNVALQHEMNGGGNYFRDGLKMHLFNGVPPEEKAGYENVLQYSTNLNRNLKAANLDPKNVHDLYQAHNLALADLHDDLSEINKDNKNLSTLYSDKAKDYREQAKAASDGSAKYHYLVNSQGEPIFLSNNSFKVLDQEGKIADWIKNGTISDVRRSDDPKFSEKYSDAQKVDNESKTPYNPVIDEKDQSTIIEALRVSHSAGNVTGAVSGILDGHLDNPEAHKEIAETIISQAIDHPRLTQKMIGDEAWDKIKDIVNDHKNKSNAEEIRSNQGQLQEEGRQRSSLQNEGSENIQQSAEGGTEAGNEKEGLKYKKNIRDDYFAKSDFFTPEEKEKFATLDEAGQDKMIDDKRAELSANPVSEEKVISSPINTDQNEKVNKGETPGTESDQGGRLDQAKTEGDQEGRSDDVVPKEGVVQPTGSDATPSLPPNEPPPITLRVPEESPKDEFTSVRKEKNKEIEGAKELFEKQKVIKWNDTYREALTNVHSMYPDKNLYDAMKARVGHFTAMLESKQLFNPTSEDNAVFNVYKLETIRRMAQVQGFDSSDPVQQLSAQTEFASLQKDLLDVAKVTNPGGEAGRAFNILQSEISNDLEHGLQIRRMELATAKGGKLTDAELESTANDWHKEQELLQKQHELELKRNEEKFNKEIDKLKNQLKESKEGEKEPATTKAKREKLLSEKGKDLADKIRGGKLKGTYATFPGLPQAINVVLEGIAQIVEKGATLAEAISQYVKDNKIKDEEKFKSDLFSVFTKQEKKEDAYSKIEDMAKNGDVTDVTNDMVAKNLIRDYVNAHVGLHDNKDILDIAHAELKKVLPDLDKNKLREAYLKDGDFKQPTKKQLENGFKQSERNFNQLTKLEKDINDLKKKGELFKKDKGKSASPYDKEVDAKEKEKKAIMTEMGIKTSSEDKYTKASYDQRATAHNERLENLSKDIEEKLNKGDISPDTEKALRNLKGKLDASKIVLDPSSALSQERTLKGGNDILKSIASEFRRTTVGDISKVGDINRSLQRAIDKFGYDKDESEQDIKLQRAKDRAKSQKDEYARKLSAGEFEDHPIVELTKSDAELIKLERDRNKERQKFEDKKKEFEKKNQSWKKRILDFTRAAIVAKLIMKPITLLRVGASAFIRPQLEAITKATFGKGFDALPFDTTKAITEQAKKGGESSSNRAIAKLYEAQYKQYGVDKIQDLYDKANDKYEKSDKEYQQAKGELDKITDKDSKEYKDAVTKLNDLQSKRNNDLVGALSYSMYQFMAGSSIKEAAEVFLHRSTELERQLGEFDREAWTKIDKTKTGKERLATAVDNINYMLNFVGRSHAALKNFSARASFASGFVARLEGYSNDGVDITRPEKLLEIAHESYLDWEMGKYQESNWVTDTWNKITNNIEKASPEVAFLFRSDVAITRVPVNMLREGLMEYTLGAFRGSIMAAREYYKAKGIVLSDGYTPENDEQFQKELREQLQRIDPKQAATIIRSFRKGGFGLGLYALAMVGKVAFGGWSHKGQSAEDKKKLEREKETGVPEIKTSQIKIGDYTLPDWVAKVAEHTPAFAPLGYGLGLAQVYQNNIIDGKTTPEAATNAVMSQIDHITGSIPQLDKVILPLAVGTAKSVLPSGQWDDVDQDGIPMKRKAFNVADYFKYLGFGEAFGHDVHFGDKSNILSEYYYKQALQNQKYFRDAITEVETNTGLSKEDKETQREEYLRQMKEGEEEIYRQNKENPQ